MDDYGQEELPDKTTPAPKTAAPVAKTAAPAKKAAEVDDYGEEIMGTTETVPSAASKTTAATSNAS